MDPPTLQSVDQTAAAFIVEQVMAHPGEITLAPLGPLTNIALALRLEPRIAENVRRVVLMGGAALVPGNVSPAAEANIHSDPEAAKIVFEAGWEVTMVGLDVTHEVMLSHEELARYAASDKATSQYIARILPLYVDFCRQFTDDRGLPMHDPTVMSYLLHPELFEVKACPVAVATQGVSRGKTWVWTWDHRVPKPGSGFDPSQRVNVVLGADVAAVNARLLETV
jgi:inosine-uridine nucleoside N-ribohydrolase